MRKRTPPQKIVIPGRPPRERIPLPPPERTHEEKRKKERKQWRDHPPQDPADAEG